MTIVIDDDHAVAECEYAPFGGIISATGEPSRIGHFRHRSYIYDQETGLYYLQSRYYDAKVGRFQNADAIVATGQGVIGNNMLAYCLNNPVNRTDANGDVSIWYYLIVDHDMGFIHRAVQLHILSMNSSNIQVEWILTGFGRADVVDVSLGVVWEVKHAGKDRALRETQAKNQAKKYIGGEHDGVIIKDLGAAGRFEGEFCIRIGKYTYEVKYDTPQDGVIIYAVNETKRSITEYNAVYEYIPKISRNDENTQGCTSIVMMTVVVQHCMGLTGGGSNSLHKKYSLN